MPVEAATYISQLVPANPLGTDVKSQGDEHLRLVKTVLQAQFSGLGAAPVTMTAAQLNSIPNLLTAPTMVDISDAGATITWNCAVPNSTSKILLDGNKTVNLGTLVIGWHTLTITQMSPVKTIAWNAAIKHYGVGSGFAPDLGSAAGHKTVVSGFYDGVEFLAGNSPKHY